MNGLSEKLRHRRQARFEALSNADLERLKPVHEAQQRVLAARSRAALSAMAHPGQNPFIEELEHESRKKYEQDLQHAEYLRTHPAVAEKLITEELRKQEAIDAIKAEKARIAEAEKARAKAMREFRTNPINKRGIAEARARLNARGEHLADYLNERFANPAHEVERLRQEVAREKELRGDVLEEFKVANRERKDRNRARAERELAIQLREAEEEERARMEEEQMRIEGERAYRMDEQLRRAEEEQLRIALAAEERKIRIHEQLERARQEKPANPREIRARAAEQRIQEAEAKIREEEQIRAQAEREATMARRERQALARKALEDETARGIEMQLPGDLRRDRGEEGKQEEEIAEPPPPPPTPPPLLPAPSRTAASERRAANRERIAAEAAKIQQDLKDGGETLYYVDEKGRERPVRPNKSLQRNEVTGEYKANIGNKTRTVFVRRPTTGSGFPRRHRKAPAHAAPARKAPTARAPKVNFAIVVDEMGNRHVV